MITLPRALHFDSSVPYQPQWDTLFGFCNPYASPISITIRCYGRDGNEVVNSPIVFTLQAGHSAADTFIKGNNWVNPPQNWDGWATISFSPLNPFESIQDLPTMVTFGGNGPAPMDWNYATPSLDLLNTSKRNSGPGTRFVFPYAIPYYRDPWMHADNHEYRTGFAITNLGTAQVNLNFKYTVGDYYPNATTQVSTTLSINPRQTIVQYVHEILPAVLTMNPRMAQDSSGNWTIPILKPDGSPEYEGSEGWIDITSLSGSADLLTYLLCSNPNGDCLGFAQTAWIIS